MQHPDPSEEQLATQLASLRTFARTLAGRRNTQAGAGVYEAVSSLVAAAEAMIERRVDERIVVALDILAEVLGDDLAAGTILAPRQVSAA